MNRRRQSILELLTDVEVVDKAIVPPYTFVRVHAKYEGNLYDAHAFSKCNPRYDSFHLVRGVNIAVGRAKRSIVDTILGEEAGESSTRDPERVESQSPRKIRGPRRTRRS